MRPTAMVNRALTGTIMPTVPEFMAGTKMNRISIRKIGATEIFQFLLTKATPRPPKRAGRIWAKAGCSAGEFKMGVRGAALATIISQFASALWTIRFLLAKKTSLRIQIKYLRPQWNIIGSVAALGVSPFIMQSTESLVSVVLSSGLQKYGGDVYVGSLTILQSIMQLINIPISGFTQGVQPILSYNYGAGNIDRVKTTYKRIITITTVASFAITLSAMLFPGVYARIFTDDIELIAVVKRVMPIFVAGMLVFGVQMGCQTTFMGLGQAKISLFMALLRKVFLLVPFAIVFPMITGNVMSIYYAECCADALAATVCGIVFLCSIRKILEKGIVC